MWKTSPIQPTDLCNQSLYIEYDTEFHLSYPLNKSARFLGNLYPLGV
jgi:hypothetical protein